jgi:hypothetical protein
MTARAAIARRRHDTTPEGADQMKKILSSMTALVAVVALTAATGAAQMTHSSKPFQGPKANAGRVTHSVEGGKHLLTLSNDFKVPDTPDPHWQVVTSKGEVFLLQRLMIQNDKLNRTITLPSFISDVAKVQIWCAWAEVNLGEAAFDRAITIN